MGNRARSTYHRLLPGQQVQFGEAMTKELSQVLTANAVRRLSQEEELNLKPERLLRMRWVLTWKLHRHLERCLVICYFKHAHCTNFVSFFGDVSSAFLQTSASEEHQELTIKAPPEVGYLFSGSEGKTCSICAFDEMVLWSNVSTPRLVVGYHTETISAWLETHCRLINVCGVVILMTVS